MADAAHGPAEDTPADGYVPEHPQLSTSPATRPGKGRWLSRFISWWAPVERLWRSFQRFLGFGVMRASAPLVKGLRTGGKVYARAQFEKMRIEERYSYRQEISLNDFIRQLEPPDGQITLALPYDGESYFTRQAHRDVVRSLRRGGELASTAIVGYLALTDYHKTNLDSLLSLGKTYGSVPLEVRLSQPGWSEADHLIADGSSCVISCSYKPSPPSVIPMQISIELEDPDTADFSPTRVGPDFSIERLKIMRHVGFRRELLLRMQVRLSIPKTLGEGVEAEVAHVNLKWPTHTSLRSLALRVDEVDHPLRYNPECQGLQWSDIPTWRDEGETDGELCTFRSPFMELSIPHPGELYNEHELVGRVEVKINRLLSGMGARIYDATGKPLRSLVPELESIVANDFELILDDAFARRALLSHQQMYFDEVIPNEMRIDDIKTALLNMGFEVYERWSADDSRWLWATRSEGPETLRLELYIEGKTHKAKRERRVPGGVKYQTALESGELRIYVYGSLPGNSQKVVEEMNALRRTLRERFERLPARR